MNSEGEPRTESTPSGSPLDKPLAELSEEDIALITREDCRRFLKAKGMRRPSWNKSQAIQQVIFLKALLEGGPEEDDCPVAPGILRKHPPPSAPPPPPSPESSTPTVDAVDPLTRKEVAVDVYPPAKEASSYRRRDPTPPQFSAGELSPGAGIDHGLSGKLSPREALTNQMTIFYDGRILVYNDVTPEQARVIMELAASRAQPGGLSDPVFLPFRSPGSVAVPSAPAVAGSFPVSTRGSTSRKASLQRYLEKKRDRFKGKRIANLAVSSSAEVSYLSQKFNHQNHFEQINQECCSPSLPQPPGTPNRCSSMDNRIRNESLY